MLGSLLEFRTENTHLSRRHVALLNHRICDSLEQQGDKYEDDAHRNRHRTEEVEYIKREPTVDVTEQRPAEVNQLLKLEVFAEGTLLLH